MNSMNDMAADHRLAPSFAIVHGYQLYYPPDHGPVLSTIYGPITALFYLPATIASSPRTAFFLAGLLALVVFHAASIFAVGSAVRRSWLKPWQMLVLLVGAVWLFPPLQRVAMSIHADVPALAAAAVAAAFAMREKCWIGRWENEIAAGLFTVLAVFAKQNVAPLLLALPLWMIFRGSWKGLAAYSGSVLACTAVMLAAIAKWFGGLAAFYFNCVYIPLHQPYDRTLLFKAYSDLLIPSAALLFLPAMLLLKQWFDRRERVLDRDNLLLLLIGIALVPTSLAGRIKFGGYENALAPTLYFFLLWAIAELSESPATKGSDSRDAKVALALVLVVCILGGVPAIFLARKARFRNPSENVFAYCTRNPGKVYFAQFPLAQLLSEGKLYHFAWGLADRHAAGVPVSEAHYAANIPESASRMALVPWVAEWDREMDSRHGPVVIFGDAPQLAGFQFYSMNSAPPANADNKARP